MKKIDLSKCSKIGVFMSIFALVGMTFVQSSESATAKITKEEYRRILQERLAKKKKEAALLENALKKSDSKTSVTSSDKSKVKKVIKRVKKNATSKAKVASKVKKRRPKYKKRYKKVKNSKNKKLKLSSQAAVSTKATNKKKRRKNKTSKSNKSTLKTSAVKPEEEKSPWSFSYLYFGSVGAEKLADGTGTIGGYNQITAAYKLDSGLKFEIAPSYSIDYSLEKGSAKHSMGNLILGVSKGGLFEVGGFSVWGRGRYYVPTGESFRKSGTNGLLRGDIKASRSFGKIGTYASLSSRYYLQSNRALASFDDLGRILSSPKPQTGLRFIPEIGASYGITKSITLEGSLGLDHSVKYDDPGLGVVDPVNPTSFDLSVGGSASITDHFSLSLYAAQSHGLSGDDVEPFSLFKIEEMSYFLVMVLR